MTLSVRTSRRVFLLALLLMCPLPVFLGVVDGLMPVARIVMLGGICVAIMVLENGNGVVGTLAGLLFAQAFIYLGLIWLTSYLASSLLGRISRRALATATLALLIAGFAIATSLDLYHTPFNSESTHVGLLGIFQ